jgi:hypothetical protein
MRNPDKYKVMKMGDEWCVTTSDGERVVDGPFATEEEAQKECFLYNVFYPTNPQYGSNGYL